MLLITTKSEILKLLRTLFKPFLTSTISMNFLTILYPKLTVT